MLTEIEWWGGLVFLWWAFSYWLLVKHWDEAKDFGYLTMHASFIFCAVVLALYFYPLASLGAKYVYLSSMGIALIAIALMFLLPSSHSPENSRSEGGETAEESVSASQEMVGQAVMLAPLLIACVLGLHKSYSLAQSLNWL